MLNPFKVYVLLSLVLTCGLTHHEYGRWWVWDARHHCWASGGVVGLIQLNTDEGRCPLDNPSERLTKPSLLLL